LEGKELAAARRGPSAVFIDLTLDSKIAGAKEREGALFRKRRKQFLGEKKRRRKV